VNLPWNSFEHAAPAVKPDIGGAPKNQVEAQKLAIIGAGLGGCWLARTLADRGVSVGLIDQYGCAAQGASGNPAGIVKPFVTRAPCHAMQFYSLAHNYLLEQLKKPDLLAAGFQPCGVAQLVHRAYPTSEQYQCLGMAQTDLQVGHSSHCQSIYFSASGWLNPQALCESLIDHPLITRHFNHKIIACKRSNALNNPPIWSLSFEKQQQLECTHLVLANGESLSMLPETQHLPLVPARGQLSRFELNSHSPAPRCVVSGKHYVIPDGKTVLVGASFQRDIVHRSVLQHDHEQNRLGLSRLLPALSVNPIAIAGYAGVRATTPDRLPVIGPAPDSHECKQAYAKLHHGNPNKQYAPLPTIKGLYLLGGFGSRGIVTAPIGAKLLADHLMGEDTLDAWAPLVNPARFLIRQLKRGPANHPETAR
jgi:tRNA 5-methylaminomethyl-2-thiouridine biosynthesis bifunctional protein